MRAKFINLDHECPDLKIEPETQDEKELLRKFLKTHWEKKNLTLTIHAASFRNGAYYSALIGFMRYRKAKA